MTQRPLGAMGVASTQSRRTGSSVRTRESELALLKVQSDALSVPDPGPVGFDFVLSDDDPGAEALLVLSRNFTWRGVLTNDGG